MEDHDPERLRRHSGRAKREPESIVVSGTSHSRSQHTDTLVSGSTVTQMYGEVTRSVTVRNVTGQLCVTHFTS